LESARYRRTARADERQLPRRRHGLVVEPRASATTTRNFAYPFQLKLPARSGDAGVVHHVVNRHRGQECRLDRLRAMKIRTWKPELAHSRGPWQVGTNSGESRRVCRLISFALACAPASISAIAGANFRVMNLHYGFPPSWLCPTKKNMPASIWPTGPRRGRRPVQIPQP